MKRKSLAVIILLFLGSGVAAATSYTFGFGSPGGGIFCNYEQINNNGMFGPDVWQGVDNLSVCGINHNATIVGLSHSIPKSAGLPVSGKGVLYADDIYDAFSGKYTGYQWLLFTRLKCSFKQYGWIGFATSPGGIVFGDNYDYLLCSIPAAGKHNGRMTTGMRAK